MKVLVIGGSGFIGSHVVDHLLARGHEVRIFDRAPERFRPTPKGATLQIGHLGDTVALATALAGVDWVFHMASSTVPSTSNLDPVADVETNLIGAIQLVKLMRDLQVKRILFLSSGGTVYGVPTVPLVTESHPLQPISSYGVVKVAIENYLHAEGHLHGLRALVLRPSNPYGPRQGLEGVQGVIGTFLRAAAQGRPLEIWGDGQIVRDFFHVEDLARLCAECAEADATGVYNAGSGTGHAIREIAQIVLDVSGRDLGLAFKTGRGFDVPRTVLDIGAITQRIGWTPQIDLQTGIAQTWEWVCAQS